jgi:glutaconate CoA-transferase subunit A
MTATDAVITIEQVIGELRSGMTIGIGGWGSRRKPMALVRALAASDLTDLTVVSYGGPDVGLLVAAGKVRRVVTGFVSLDSIPLEPHFRLARQRAAVALTELDEGMLHWGLLAAAHRLPFLPMRAGLASDVMRVNPELRTVRSPYADGEELVAVPARRLDVALIHMNRADPRGNGQYLGPDPYFDDLFCLAASRAYMSCERIVPTAELVAAGPPQSLLINRAMVAGVVETPNGAHFTSCVPDYGRDEAFQALYARSATKPEAWESFAAEFLAGDEADYQVAVGAWAAERAADAAQAAADAGQPAADTAQPGSDGAQAGADAGQPAADTAQPGSGAAQAAAEPAVQSAAAQPRATPSVVNNLKPPP